MELSVTDDGTGFDVTHTSQGFGLAGSLLAWAYAAPSAASVSPMGSEKDSTPASRLMI